VTNQTAASDLLVKLPSFSAMDAPQHALVYDCVRQWVPGDP
jgi:hypothetical protein